MTITLLLIQKMNTDVLSLNGGKIKENMRAEVSSATSLYTTWQVSSELVHLYYYSQPCMR